MPFLFGHFDLFIGTTLTLRFRLIAKMKTFSTTMIIQTGRYQSSPSLQNYNSLLVSPPSSSAHSTVSVIHLFHEIVQLASMAANELTRLISQLPAPSASQPPWV
ncbi:uncharacterized protein IAS62_005122 [Cryptococcus decagattii]|uniref:Uncharacterized protein n=1 Tax=Cryptococcus decagattii TaxID=1859122 RepID=A0ABZ2AZ02_9TREE